MRAGRREPGGTTEHIYARQICRKPVLSGLINEYVRAA